jgi:adenylate cyclase class 2
MKHEYEARFRDVDHDLIRRQLREEGATCVNPRQPLKRVIFENDTTRRSRSWLRLRTNGDQTTLTLKRGTGDTADIESTLELETLVADFESMQCILDELGLTALRLQENYREEWHLDGITYDLDEWPNLNPFLEIEGPDPESVRLAAKKLGLNFDNATFGDVDELYLTRLGHDILKEPRLVFLNTKH